MQFCYSVRLQRILHVVDLLECTIVAPLRARPLAPHKHAEQQQRKLSAAVLFVSVNVHYQLIVSSSLHALVLSVHVVIGNAESVHSSCCLM